MRLGEKTVLVTAESIVCTSSEGISEMNRANCRRGQALGAEHDLLRSYAVDVALSFLNTPTLPAKQHYVLKSAQFPFPFFPGGIAPHPTG